MCLGLLLTIAFVSFQASLGITVKSGEDNDRRVKGLVYTAPVSLAASACATTDGLASPVVVGLDTKSDITALTVIELYDADCPDAFAFYLYLYVIRDFFCIYFNL